MEGLDSSKEMGSSDDFITLEELKDNIYWHPFVIYTKTTGFPGCPPYHPKHKILHIFCEDIITGKVFSRYVNNPDIHIGETIYWLTGINENVLFKKDAQEGRLVMTDLLKWVYRHSDKKDGKKKTPLIIGYDVVYDRNMILKTVPMDCGKGGEKMSWKWLDLFTTIKTKYPDLKYNTYADKFADKPFKKKPYAIDAVIYHFYNQFNLNLISTDVYITWVKKLFMEKVAPVIWETLSGNICEEEDESYGMVLVDEEAWHKLTPGILTPRSHFTFSVEYSILTPLHSIPHIKSYIPAIVDFLNAEHFKVEHGLGSYVTNEQTITCAHLYSYGRSKLLSAATTNSIISPYTDVWYQILMHVEIFLRYKIGIYNDEILLSILAPMTNRSPIELYNNSYIEGYDVPIFPALPGHPVSYFPFQFSLITATNLYENFGIKTAHDLFIDYMVFKDGCTTETVLYTKTSLKGWVFKMLSGMNMANNEEFTEALCEEKFKLIIPAYQKE